MKTYKHILKGNMLSRGSQLQLHYNNITRINSQLKKFILVHMRTLRAYHKTTNTDISLIESRNDSNWQLMEESTVFLLDEWSLGDN